MTIEILYPEVCNLYADLQNVEYLKRSANGKIDTVSTALHDEPLFATRDDLAMIYMGSVTESGQERVIKALMPYRERIAELIDKGQLFFITGNALEIFGEYIQCEDGSRIECLGIFPTYAVRKMMNRYNSLWVGQYGDIDVVGFKSQFTQTYFTNDKEEPDKSVYGKPEGLFMTERGDGINPGTKEEGYRKNNFFATYLLGPLFITNPYLAAKMLAKLDCGDSKPLFEKESIESYEKRLKEFREPERGFTY